MLGSAMKPVLLIHRVKCYDNRSNASCATRNALSPSWESRSQFTNVVNLGELLESAGWVNLGWVKHGAAEFDLAKAGNVCFKVIRSQVAGEEDEIIEGRTIGGQMQNGMNVGGVFTPFQKLKYYQLPTTKSGQKLLDPVADAVTMRCSDDFAIANYINPEQEIPNSLQSATLSTGYIALCAAQPENVWRPKYEEAREVLRRLMVEAMGDMKANNDYAKLRRDDKKDHVLQVFPPDPPQLTSKAAKPRQKSPKKVKKNTNNRSVTVEVWIPLRPVRTEQVQLVEIAEGETRSETLGSGRQVDLRNLSWAKFMERVAGEGGWIQHTAADGVVRQVEDSEHLFRAFSMLDKSIEEVALHLY
ncbi:hypothetical protein LTR15_011207 [Elasticomyces elasticus]|nr:hypothetical protein LTR15_011207 [Elasticomyces elasticus]